MNQQTLSTIAGLGAFALVALLVWLVPDRYTRPRPPAPTPPPAVPLAESLPCGCATASDPIVHIGRNGLHTCMACGISYVPKDPDA